MVTGLTAAAVVAAAVDTVAVVAVDGGGAVANPVDREYSSLASGRHWTRQPCEVAVAVVAVRKETTWTPMPGSSMRIVIANGVASQCHSVSPSGSTVIEATDLPSVPSRLCYPRCWPRYYCAPADWSEC